MENWFIKRIGNGTFLNGTDTPNQLDIHVYVIVERLIMFEHTVYEGAKKMEVQKNMPVVCKYVENFRNYSVFTEHCITLDAF